jgi:DNA-binding response OmpR family regulator
MNKAKILIVEKENAEAINIKNTILGFGYEVINIVSNYTDTLKVIDMKIPDIITMGINLENGEDGIELAKEIQKLKNIPIIYLTTCDDDETMTRAIETNPISYLLKPINKNELKSALLLAMFKINRSNQLIIDKRCTPLGFDYYFDMETQSLFLKTTPIKLSVKERKLLSILVEAKGSPVSFYEIEYIIWPQSQVTNGAIRTLVYRLRAKLEHKLIEAVPPQGFKLTPVF